MRAIPQRQPLFLGGSIGGVPSFDLNFARGDNAVTKYGFVFTRATSATYVNSTGLIATAASGELRYTYDPVTLSALGVLIEEARTNLALASAGIDNATYWTPTLLTTVSANGATAPDGTSAADGLVADASSAVSHRVAAASAISVSSATQYTLSVYLKPGNKNYALLSFSGAYPYVGYDLVAGTVTGIGTNTVSASATATLVGNGWCRCTLTVTTLGTTISPQIYAYNQSYAGGGSGPTNWAGDAATVNTWVWGAQFEAGAFPTSYIPTTGTAATRNADVLSLTGAADVIASWFNKDAGTIVEKVAAQASTAFASATPVVWIDDGSANNRFGVRTQGGAYNGLYTVRSAGVAVADQVITAAFAYGVEKTIAYAYAVNDFQAAVNGSLNVPVTSGALPSGLTTVRIGRDSSAVTFTGTISRIRYYPRRLPNATLQSLTA